MNSLEQFDSLSLNNGAEHIGGGDKIILIYPDSDCKNGGKYGAVALTVSDLFRLQPHVYLNDNLIDFYLRYIYLEK